MYGNQVIVQIGKETAYGDGATTTAQLKVFSESVKTNFNRKEEGVLTGGLMKSKSFAMGEKVEGNLSFIARPDDIGLWLLSAFGSEGTVTTEGTLGKKHVFTMVDTEVCPSLSLIIDRVIKSYKYSGVKVESLSFSAQPGDFLKLDVGILGKDESEDEPEALSASALQGFRFSGAVVTIGGTAYEVASIKFDLKLNNDTIQTNVSGPNFTEPVYTVRAIDVSLSLFYEDAVETLRDTYFVTNAPAALSIKFLSDELIDTSPALHYSLELKVPSMQVEDCSPVIGDAQRTKVEVKLSAIESATAPTAELVNTRATVY